MRLIVDIRECSYSDLDENKTFELKRKMYREGYSSFWEGGYLISIEDIDEDTARFNVFVGNDPRPGYIEGDKKHKIPFSKHIENIILGIRDTFRGEIENGKYVLNPDRFKTE